MSDGIGQKRKLETVSEDDEVDFEESQSDSDVDQGYDSEPAPDSFRSVPKFRDVDHFLRVLYRGAQLPDASSDKKDFKPPNKS